ncbi:hypothetical protein ACS0TY_019593 [Phlomoides rotata]
MSTLNPSARPFIPPSIQEKRSLFMTFSFGSPLTREDIVDHFNRIGYGECVEDVVLHTRRGREPMSGYIVFCSSELPRIILGNQEIVKISVNEKPVWFKKYVPRTQRIN